MSRAASFEAEVVQDQATIMDVEGPMPIMPKVTSTKVDVAPAPKKKKVKKVVKDETVVVEEKLATQLSVEKIDLTTVEELQQSLTTE